MAFTPPPAPHPKMPQGWYGQYNPKYQDSHPQEVYDLVNAGAVSTHIDIAKHFNTVYSTLLRWMGKYKEFNAAMQYAKEAFENKLVKTLADGNGGAGQIFLLKAKCGYIEHANDERLKLDKAELDAKLAGKIDANGNRPISINFVEVQPDQLQSPES